MPKKPTAREKTPPPNTRTEANVNTEPPQPVEETRNRLSKTPSPQTQPPPVGLDKQNQERTMMRSLSGRGFVEREKDVGAEPSSSGDLTHEFKQFKLFRLPSLPHHQPDHCLPPSPRSHRSNHHRRSQTERGNPRPLRKHTGACPQWNRTSTSA
ncbi:hypothetical protein YC2023_012310 [Brassica napus]